MILTDLLSVGISESSSQSLGWTSLKSEEIVIVVGGGVLISDREDATISCFFTFG